MSWWERLWHRRRMEDQLEKELYFHIEQHIADLIARGHTPEVARKEARLALGGAEQVKEGCRDARGTRWAEDLLQDFRYTLRTLRQRPSFAAVVLCTLALGTGATTIMFTLVDGVLLKPLPYADPDSLIAVHGQTSTWNVALNGQQNVAYLDFRDLQRESRSLSIAGRLFNGGTVSSPGEPQYADNIQISSNVFDLLGVPLLKGRSFLPQEDRPGGTPVAVLGYSFWRRQLNGSPTVIGSHLVFDAKPYTIVGIARPNFKVSGDEADVYTPLGQNTAAYMQVRGPHPVGVLARLRPSATLAQAQAELELLGPRLAAQYPATNKDRTFVADRMHADVGNVRSTLWLLLGAVTLVLLIACANIASLLLARAVSRERELAMRAALGAGRGRLIRQCLTESIVLAFLGGALGILLATVGVHPFVTFWPGSLPRADEVTLDWRVLLFALAVSFASGILFGLVPALRTRTHNLEQTLRAGARAVIGSSRRLHNGFVIAEIALAVVLLVSAAMLGRTLTSFFAESRSGYP